MPLHNCTTVCADLRLKNFPVTHYCGIQRPWLSQIALVFRFIGAWPPFAAISASSAFAKNFYGGVWKKEADDKKIMWISRIALLTVALIGIVIAWDENSIIFNVVSFAWAGFGATFGPIMLFSLFWKRTNRAGAIAGMLSGGLMVFFWKLVLKPMGGIFGIYELLPAFVFSCIVIVVVSLMTAPPSKEIQEEFELAKCYKD